MAAALGVTLLVATAGCTGGGQAQRPPARGAAGPTPVAAATAHRRDLTRTVTLTGPVEPVRTVGVNSRTSGTILTVKAIEGDRVRTGQLLAELDAGETRAQLDRAQALLAAAKAAFERSQALHERQMVTDAEFEQAGASYGTARSDVALWQARLAFTRISAPTGGVVTTKYIEAGSAVAPNQRLFDIADDTLQVVRLQMSELDVVHIAAGDSVGVTFDALPGIPVAARVRRVFPAADPQTRLVPVEVALGAPPVGVAIKPGFLARVEFAVERRPAVLAIPASAVGAAATGSFVYVVDADTLERRSVATGLTSSGFVEVTRGLAEGEVVVVSGQVNLQSGTRVQVVERQGQTPVAVSAEETAHE